MTDAAGTQVTGTLTDLSAASLSVQLPAARATFAEAQVQRIERIGDPLWNGALIGLGAGVAGGLVGVAASDALTICAAWWLDRAWRSGELSC